MGQLREFLREAVNHARPGAEGHKHCFVSGAKPPQELNQRLFGIVQLLSRIHAAAGVEKNDHAQWDVLAAELTDHLRHAIVVNNKIIQIESGYKLARLILNCGKQAQEFYLDTDAIVLDLSQGTREAGNHKPGRNAEEPCACPSLRVCPPTI